MDGPTQHGRLVTLRPMVEADRRRMIEIRSSADVARWWRSGDLDEWFSECLTDHETRQYAIEVGDGTVVGMIQWGEETDPEYRHASIDIFVDPAEHRRGYATDAIETLAAHLFDDCDHHRLVIDPSVDNHAAIACYAKVGFTTVGVMRSYERRADGTWGDGLLMELLRTDRQP